MERGFLSGRSAGLSRPPLPHGLSPHAKSVADLAIASTLAIAGIAMTPLPALVVASTLAAAIAFSVILDLAKVPLFVRLGIA